MVHGREVGPPNAHFAHTDWVVPFVGAFSFVSWIVIRQPRPALDDLYAHTRASDYKIVVV